MRSLIRGVPANIAGCGSIPAGDKGNNWSTLTQPDCASPDGPGTRGAVRKSTAARGRRAPLASPGCSALCPGCVPSGSGVGGVCITSSNPLVSPPPRFLVGKLRHETAQGLPAQGHRTDV